MTSQQTGGLKPTRRTLVKGAAWSVPVVAMAQPVRAQDAACSPGSCPINPTFNGVACKHPGGGTEKYYHFGFCFENTSDQDALITVNRLCVGSECGSAFIDTTAVNTFVVPAGDTVCKDVDGGPFGDSQNEQGVLHFSWIGIGEPDPGTNPIQPGSSSVATGYNDLPPCQQIGEPKDFPHPNGVSQSNDSVEESTEQAPQNVTTVEEPVVEAEAVEPAPSTEAEAEVDTTVTDESVDTFTEGTEGETN